MKKIIYLLVLMSCLQNMIEPKSIHAQPKSPADVEILNRILNNLKSKVNESTSTDPIKENVTMVIDLYIEGLSGNNNFTTSLEHNTGKLFIDCHSIAENKFNLHVDSKLVSNENFYQILVDEILLLIYEKNYYETKKVIPCDIDFSVNVKKAKEALFLSQNTNGDTVMNGSWHH